MNIRRTVDQQLDKDSDKVFDKGSANRDAKMLRAVLSLRPSRLCGLFRCPFGCGSAALGISWFRLRFQVRTRWDAHRDGLGRLAGQPEKTNQARAQ